MISQLKTYLFIMLSCFAVCVNASSSVDIVYTIKNEREIRKLSERNGQFVVGEDVIMSAEPCTRLIKVLSYQDNLVVFAKKDGARRSNMVLMCSPSNCHKPNSLAAWMYLSDFTIVDDTLFLLSKGILKIDLKQTPKSNYDYYDTQSSIKNAVKIFSVGRNLVLITNDGEVIGVDVDSEGNLKNYRTLHTGIKDAKISAVDDKHFVLIHGDEVHFKSIVDNRSDVSRPFQNGMEIGGFRIFVIGNEVHAFKKSTGMAAPRVHHALHSNNGNNNNNNSDSIPNLDNVPEVISQIIRECPVSSNAEKCRLIASTSKALNLLSPFLENYIAEDVGQISDRSLPKAIAAMCGSILGGSAIGELEYQKWRRNFLLQELESAKKRKFELENQRKSLNLELSHLQQLSFAMHNRGADNIGSNSINGIDLDMDWKSVVGDTVYNNVVWSNNEPDWKGLYVAKGLFLCLYEIAKVQVENRLRRVVKVSPSGIAPGNQLKNLKMELFSVFKDNMDDLFPPAYTIELMDQVLKDVNFDVSKVAKQISSFGEFDNEHKESLATFEGNDEELAIFRQVGDAEWVEKNIIPLMKGLWEKLNDKHPALFKQYCKLVTAMILSERECFIGEMGRLKRGFNPDSDSVIDGSTKRVKRVLIVLPRSGTSSSKNTVALFN